MPTLWVYSSQVLPDWNWLWGVCHLLHLLHKMYNEEVMEPAAINTHFWAFVGSLLLDCKQSVSYVLREWHPKPTFAHKKLWHWCKSLFELLWSKTFCVALNVSGDLKLADIKEYSVILTPYLSVAMFQKNLKTWLSKISVQSDFSFGSYEWHVSIPHKGAWKLSALFLAIS